MTERTRQFITVWLSVCCLLIFTMVLLGGAVRLTGSGLSMVDWKPLMGIIPPFTDSAWDMAFGQYKKFPEYKIVNAHITQEYFKFIYLMEYSHRNLGRLIGLVYFLPFMYLVFTGKLNSILSRKLWILFAMGAIQGGVGWYMVKSGLVGNPQVDQYRLVLHLMIAVLIYTYMTRVVAGMSPRLRNSQVIAPKFGAWVLVIILLMISSGGFVAGTHAGFLYNTFPTMNGEWIPTDVNVLSPFWRNFFENPITIQFVHRALALLVLVLVVIYGLIFARDEKNILAKIVGYGMIVAVFLQISVGIATLLSGVPPWLGVAHQAGALILLTSVVISVSVGRPITPE